MELRNSCHSTDDIPCFIMEPRSTQKQAMRKPLFWLTFTFQLKSSVSQLPCTAQASNPVDRKKINTVHLNDSYIQPSGGRCPLTSHYTQFLLKKIIPKRILCCQRLLEIPILLKETALRLDQTQIFREKELYKIHNIIQFETVKNCYYFNDILVLHTTQNCYEYIPHKKYISHRYNFKQAQLGRFPNVYLIDFMASVKFLACFLPQYLMLQQLIQSQTIYQKKSNCIIYDYVSYRCIFYVLGICIIVLEYSTHITTVQKLGEGCITNASVATN